MCWIVAGELPIFELSRQSGKEWVAQRGLKAAAKADPNYALTPLALGERVRRVRGLPEELGEKQDFTVLQSEEASLRRQFLKSRSHQIRNAKDTLDSRRRAPYLNFPAFTLQPVPDAGNLRFRKVQGAHGFDESSDFKRLGRKWNPLGIQGTRTKAE